MVVSPVVFLKEVRAELSKVVWPTKKETVKLTAVVIGVSVVVGLFLGTVDYILTKIMELIIKWYEFIQIKIIQIINPNIRTIYSNYCRSDLLGLLEYGYSTNSSYTTNWWQ